MKKLSKNVILQVLDCAPSGMLIVYARKPGFPIAYANAAVEVNSGYEKGELIGRPWTKLLEDQDGSQDFIESQLSDIHFDQPSQPQLIEQYWKTKSGRSLFVRLNVSPLYDRPGMPTYLLLSQSESGSAEQLREEDPELSFGDTFLGTRRRMMRMNRTDSATGIPNHAAFLEVVDRDWAIARREQRRLSVIIFQVDALDEYSASFGRHATYSTLRKIAHAITGSLRRHGDFGARYSNDRFAVVMSNTDPAQVTSVAEHVASKVRSLAVHHPKSTTDKFVTISYGIATEIPEWTASCSTLLDSAEESLSRSTPANESDQAAG